MLNSNGSAVQHSNGSFHYHHQSYRRPLRDRVGRNGEREMYQESANEVHIDNLYQKVEILRDITGGIQEDIKKDGTLLDQMFEKMGSTGQSLGSTMTKMKNMADSGSSRHMCYLVLFTMFVLLIIWYMIRTS